MSTIPALTESDGSQGLDGQPVSQKRVNSRFTERPCLKTDRPTGRRINTKMKVNEEDIKHPPLTYTHKPSMYSHVPYTTVSWSNTDCTMTVTA